MTPLDAPIQSRCLWILVLATALTALPPAPAAASHWPDNPSEWLTLCAYPENRYMETAVSDGEGGFIVVWSDGRSGWLNTYAQRVDGYGNPLWLPGGVALGVNSANQQDAQVVSDGDGGAIVVWMDYRNDAGDLFAQRVDRWGTVPWSADGVAVCDTTGAQSWARLVPTDDNGAILAWHDQRSGGYQVYVQRLDRYGVSQWQLDGLRMCLYASNQCCPEIATDGDGGAIVTWYDDRGADLDIYAGRVNAGGTVFYSGTGVEVCTASGDQRDPQIVSDGAGGGIIAWNDWRSGGGDVYAQRVDHGVNVLWVGDGVLACGSHFAGSLRATTDGAGGAVLTWSDDRSATADIYAQRVDASGTAVWTADGVVVCDAGGDQWAPEIVPCPYQEGVIIAWKDDRGFLDDLYAQRLTSGGYGWWTEDGVTVATGTGHKTNVRIVPDGEDGAFIQWLLSSDYDMCANRILHTGWLGYPSPDITGVNDYPHDQGGTVIASWSASSRDRFPYRDVLRYSVWRTYLGDEPVVPEPVQPPAALAERMPVSLLNRLEKSGWSYAGEVEACYLDEYAFDVPTYGDSTEDVIPLAGVLVIAHGDDDAWDTWPSEPDTGYSIDNLPPGAPLNLEGWRAGPDVVLDWDRPGDQPPDLSFYALYRDTEPGFVPGGLADTIATSTDTTFIDTDTDETNPYYYRVSAVDIHGNEGTLSNEVEVSPLAGVGSENGRLCYAPAFPPPHPNPFNPETVIEFVLPVASEVSLDVFDVRGEHVVRLVGELLAPGPHRVVWNGTDEAGRSVASGVFYCRLTWSGEKKVQRMVLLK